MLIDKTIKNLPIQVDLTEKDVLKYLSTVPAEQLQGIQEKIAVRLPQADKAKPTDEEVEAFLNAATQDQLEYFQEVIEDNLVPETSSYGTVISIDVQCLGHGLDIMAAEKLAEYINRVGLDTAAERIIGRG